VGDLEIFEDLQLVQTTAVCPGDVRSSGGGGAAAVVSVEVVDAEIVIRHVVPRHEIHGGEQGPGDGDDRLLRVRERDVTPVLPIEAIRRY